MRETIATSIKKELKIDKAKITEEDKTKGVTSIANITMDQVVKIAKEKMDTLSTKEFKLAVKQVIGTITSMQGITVEGKTTKEIIEEINEGKWDEKINA